ncbi:MAG: hemerythrin domain-containing protein [Ignavibacteria bacterium]|nr:hemerythrin domain-containing protein [Ignavibacteria bacterium]
MKRDTRLYYLSWDHRAALMEAFNITKYIDSKNDNEVIATKHQILKFWSEHLLMHFRSEEECILPRLAKYLKSNHPLVARTLEEHIEIHKMITLLKNEETTNKLRELLKSFADTLKNHIRFEERILFEEVQKCLNEIELTQIKSEIDERYGEKYKSSSCSLPEIESE